MPDADQSEFRGPNRRYWLAAKTNASELSTCHLFPYLQLCMGEARVLHRGGRSTFTTGEVLPSEVILPRDSSRPSQLTHSRKLLLHH